MSVLNDKEQTHQVYCAKGGALLHFHFKRRTLAEPLPDPMTCPACGDNHVGWARVLADKHGLAGWQATLLPGAVPLSKPPAPETE